MAHSPTDETRLSSARRSLGAGSLMLSLLSTAGCVDPDATVLVDVSIGPPTATLTAGTLVSAIEGSLRVHLHLGPRASGAAVVQLGALTVTDATQTTTFISPLQVEATPPFPLTVEPDTEHSVVVTFAAQDNELPVDLYEDLCLTGQLVISGAFDDSLRGGTVVAASPAFTPAGCP